MKKLIVVAGFNSLFLKKAIDKIIELSGYSEEFDVEIAETFDRKIEYEASLIFTGTKDGGTFEDYQNIIDWMRSSKHAYCMKEGEHPMGMNNYNNLKAMIMPMNFKFKPMDFTKCNPSELVEYLRPVENVKES